MKPATERLVELYTLIRDQYAGILTKEDLSTIYFTLGNRIDDILEEEKSLATYHTLDEETYKSL
jgi:hypothetical protein